MRPNMSYQPTMTPPPPKVIFPVADPDPPNISLPSPAQHETKTTPDNPVENLTFHSPELPTRKKRVHHPYRKQRRNIAGVLIDTSTVLCFQWLNSEILPQDTCVILIFVTTIFQNKR